MKKLLCLFSASLLVLTSCSNGDDSPTVDSTTAILPKKVIYTETDGTFFASEVTYNGNKIVSVIQDGDKTNYTYTGDVITKIVELDVNNATDNIIEYTYANGKVASFVESEPGAPSKYKTIYTYNSDGSVSYKASSIDIATNVENENSTGVLTFKDGNIIKEVRTSNGFVNTTTHEYDTKNNAVKNVLGLNLLLDNEQFVSVNNVVKSTEVSSYSDGGGTSTYVYTNTYTYDANGFPTEWKSFDNDGKLTGTMQYFY